jgi:hypothetical protein
MRKIHLNPVGNMDEINFLSTITKSLSSKLPYGVAVGLVLSLSNISSASAQQVPLADFFFTPAGTQLDSDPILDIEIGPGVPITFSPGLIDGFIRTEIFDSYTVNYRVSWDTTELLYIANPTISGLALTSDFSLSKTCLTNCSLLFRTVNPVNNGLTDFSYILDNVFINQIGGGEPIETALLNGVVGGQDITADFSPINDFSDRGVPVTPGSGFQQVVEVQHIGIPPVPGPLPLLGVGAAFGFTRKLRKRINSSKLPVASAID